MSLTSFEDDILSCEDPEECTFHLTAVIRVHLDVQAQVKSFQTKERFCPWVDEVAKLTILRKQKLHAIWKKTGKMEDKKKYRECSNFLSWDLRRKKSAYIQGRLRSTLGSKDMWKAAKSQVGWSTLSAPTSLSINGQLSSKNQEMVQAQAQNEFFDQKPKNIAKKIPKSDKDPLDYTRDFLKDKNVPGFDLGEVTEFDVIRIIGHWQLQEIITTRFEKGQDTALLCFDSSAAFDTLSHKILLSKLSLYGVSEQALKWFKSYLSDREQCWEIGGKRSTFTKIGQGVFQGSVLGPILYILYVNCIVTLEDTHTKLSLYADDTTAATALCNRVRL